MAEAPTAGQAFPFPEALGELVDRMEYRPGWKFFLSDIDRGQGSKGLTLQVLSKGYDTYHPERGETYRVWHYMPVPPAAFNERSWKRWLLEQLIAIETHEVCEFLRFEYDDRTERPFAPNHGPGHDPYVVRELNTLEDAETTFQGKHIEGSQNAKRYPYQDGDATVVGPECVVSKDGSVISWKGEHYVKASVE